MDKGIDSLILFFKNLKKISALGENGKAFENKICLLLTDRGFVRKDFRTNDINDPLCLKIELEKKKEIKKAILDKEYVNLIKNNSSEKLIYIYQPFGSQNFPDFLIFTDHWILPLEVKFSARDLGNFNPESSKPKWNSNIPKSNSLYIYGAAKSNSITFFKGSDFLGMNTRSLLIDYFKDIDKMTKELKETLKENIFLDNSNPFGLSPYIRKDYVYSNSFSTDKNCVPNLFEYSKINGWEKNLTDFLIDIKDSTNEGK